MHKLAFRIVNVFAETPLGGNPLCVFEDASELDTATMQALALQFNLSETTFVLPAQDASASRRVRIFTPMFEMPFIYVSGGVFEIGSGMIRIPRASPA